MILSYKTYSTNDIKKLIKQSKKPNSRAKGNKKPTNNENYHEINVYVQTIRQHELKILELRNELLKREIQSKQKSQHIKEMEKEILALRRDKQMFNKSREKFELQRKAKAQIICELESQNEQCRAKLEGFQVPKDRYQTCMRELDELKINIQINEEILRERNLYKYFYDEMQELVVSSEYSAEQVRNSLKSFFLEVASKMKPPNGRNDQKLFSK